MPGSSFGDIFRITTFGESHGPALGVVIDGVPPKLPLTLRDIQHDLDRRRPGQSDITTPRNESDQVEILSGVFEDQTTGAPIALLVRNKNQVSTDYTELKDIFRPGHADYTFFKKYGIRDHRGGGRSSGRETLARVAAGAIAKKLLARHGITIIGYTKSVGDIQANQIDVNEIEKNPVRCPDPIQAVKMMTLISLAKEEGDSVGGVIEAVIRGCPAGLGDPVFNKLDARLAHALMSIGTVKGIEFGSGFEGTRLKGSEHNDHFEVSDNRIQTKTNHAGGILGGISNGEEIILRVAIKPASSISKRQDTVNTSNQATHVEVHGRHDPCICPRAVPVVEAMIALTLADCLLLQATLT